MRKTDDTARIVIAVTEFTLVHQLWREALQRLRKSRAELFALFVTDDRWHRAASLPFTREISKVSGMDADFTLRRASQVHEEAIDRTQCRMEELASEADLALIFEVLRESDQKRIHELVAGSQNILIAPSFMTRQPLFAELQKLDCRIVLIEAEEESDENKGVTGQP
jgi:hypothetical protein